MTKDFWKNEEDITTMALVDLRNRKDKSLLNNKNVDCYVYGYKAAQNIFYEWLKEYNNEDNRTRLEKLLRFCNDKINSINEELGYSGYMYSMPKSAEVMLKLLSDMATDIGFVIEHLEDIKLHFKDYYKTI